jgi:hypothetical protein
MRYFGGGCRFEQVAADKCQFVSVGSRIGRMATKPPLALYRAFTESVHLEYPGSGPKDEVHLTPKRSIP